MINSDGLQVVMLHGCHSCGAQSRIASNAICADLDHSNEELRGALKEWLSWLRNEIGFMGWRFDFVKGLVTCAPTLEHALHHISYRQQVVQCWVVSERSICCAELESCGCCDIAGCYLALLVSRAAVADS